MEAPTSCPVCGTAVVGWGELATHLVERAGRSDGDHIMWLNRRVTKHRRPAAELEADLVATLSGDEPSAPRVRR